LIVADITTIRLVAKQISGWGYLLRLEA